jgi:hypothetical protein
MYTNCRPSVVGEGSGQGIVAGDVLPSVCCAVLRPVRLGLLGKLKYCCTSRAVFLLSRLSTAGKLGTPGLGGPGGRALWEEGSIWGRGRGMGGLRGLRSTTIVIALVACCASIMKRQRAVCGWGCCGR